jgi:hypothetical protein
VTGDTKTLTRFDPGLWGWLSNRSWVVQGACHRKFPLVDTYMSAPEAEVYVSFQKNLAKSPEIFS